MNNGTVKWFNGQKGYGFIQPEGGGKDVFVHISAVERAGLRELREGQRVSFEVVVDRKTGKQAAVRHDLEGNALTFPQFAKAGAFDGADMDKHVLTTALGLDESIPLLRVEPLHGTVAHGSLLVDMSI